MKSYVIYMTIALLVLSLGHIKDASAAPPCEGACNWDGLICAARCLGNASCLANCWADWVVCRAGCSGSGGLPYFAAPQTGIILYGENDTVSAEFGRHDSTGFLEGQGTVTSVELYSLALEDIDTTVSPDSNAFQFLGDATFNASTNRWEYNWNTGSFDSPTGYLIKADFFDPTAPDGKTSGFVAAVKSGNIPTLTEWGLIIFGVVLLGLITWVFLRRRRAVVSLQ